MSRGFVVARFRGVDVVLDVSMLILASLLVWSLYADLVSQLGGGGFGTIVLSVLGGVLFLAAVLLHEISHTVLALRRGLEVTRIRLFLFGGVSEIQQEAETPRDEFLISVAGPVTSAALGGAFLGLGLILPVQWSELNRVLIILGWANLSLAVFNILPGFPLDGGRALRALLWRRRGDKASATSTAVRVGKQFGLVVIGVGAYLAIRGLAIPGMWTVLVGWFVNRTAVAAERREEFLGRVRGYTIGDAMRPLTETVRQDLTVERLLELYTVGPRLATQAVESEGRVIGLIGMLEVEGIPEEYRGEMLVADAMARIGPDDVMAASTALEELLGRVSSPSRRIVATRDGRAVGVLTSHEFARFLRSGATHS